MHRGHQKSKLSLFKSSSKSQASLLTDQSGQDQQQTLQQQRQRLSPQPSPVDSPLYSPSFPPSSATASAGSTSTSPVALENDCRSNFQESSILIPRSEPQSQRQAPRNKLRRSQSYRSPPTNPTTSNWVGPDPGSAARPSSRISNEGPYGSNTSTHRQPEVEQPAQEQKTKRRFWGFGDSSTTKEKTPYSAKPLGRSLSTRLSQPQSASIDSPGQPISRQRWPASPNLPSPTEEDESEIDILSSKIPNRHSVAFPAPTVPEELRSLVGSTGFDLSSERTYNRPDLSVTTASSQLPSSGQAGAQRTPAWERIGRTTPSHSRNTSADQHPSLVRQQLAPGPSTGQQTSPPELSFLGSRSKPESRPPSRQSVDSPSPPHHTIAFHQKTPSVQSTPSIIETSMGSSSQQHLTGRNTETPQSGSQSSSNREGQYGSTLSVNNQQASAGNYRNPPQAPPMVQQNSNSEHGRSTPPPSRSRDDLATMDVQQLIQKHEELNDKYRKVKKYYFDKDAQVQQLQNTLAHQRLAQSRTSLDDNEYANRFSRLDGAINNLAFNIRKEWKAVPRWLAPYVNQDATTTVTKEMTAVGRACISRWIVDEIFDRYFHPALEPVLSSHLKNIERNLRRYAPPTPTEEERDSLLAKISNWRLATLDGLQDTLNTHDALEYRSSLTKVLVEMLTADLMNNLKEPGPVGLDAGVIGIIELAVGVAANLPLESRDVFIDYVMPSTPVNDLYMKVEGALPPLVNPGEGPDGDRASLGSTEDREDEENGKEQGQGKKKGMFGSLIGGGKKPVPGGRPDAAEQAPKEAKVRFAAFMSVELRGKNMLIKAPVYV